MKAKPGSRWTEVEVCYLIENAGKKSIEQIANKLGRSFAYTVNKAGELGLGDGKLISPLYTSNHLAKILGVASSTIGSWTDEQGLPFKWIRYRKSFQYKMIDMFDFYHWAEQRQEQLDTRKFKIPNLGNEPEWLRQKRSTDAALPGLHLRLWGQTDAIRLIALVKSQMPLDELAKLFNRTESGIRRKIDRLKALGSLPIDKRGEFYSKKEERILIECKGQGLTHMQIATKLKRSKHSVDTKWRMLKKVGAACECT